MFKIHQYNSYGMIEAVDGLFFLAKPTLMGKTPYVYLCKDGVVRDSVTPLTMPLVRVMILNSSEVGYFATRAEAQAALDSYLKATAV